MEPKLPPPLPRANDGMFEAWPAAVSWLVLIAVVAVVVGAFVSVNPLVVLVWSLSLFASPGLMFVVVVVVVPVVIAMFVLLRRSAYRAATVLSFAIMLAAAALFVVAWDPPSAGINRINVRTGLMVVGLALAAWGAVSVIRIRKAQRAATLDSPTPPRRRMHAAFPTLLAAFVLVLLAAVLIIDWK